MQENDMAKVLQRMAASLSQLNATNRSTAPVYASQLSPYPAESVPAFDGNNVTDFIEQFEDLAKFYRYSDSAMINRITAYCKPRQREMIQASYEYEKAVADKSWKSL